MVNTATSLEERMIAKQESGASKTSSAAYKNSRGNFDKSNGIKSMVSQSSLDFEERYRANMLSQLLGVSSSQAERGGVNSPQSRIAPELNQEQDASVARKLIKSQEGARRVRYAKDCAKNFEE